MCLSVARQGRCNDGPGFIVYSAHQEGPHVRLEVRIPDERWSVDAECGGKFDLLRRGEHESSYVFDDRTLCVDESEGIFKYCVEGTKVHKKCEEEPERCRDCEGDGTYECRADCEKYHVFEFVDYCVPEGDWEYEFSFPSATWPARKKIEVEYVEHRCRDDDELSCSVTEVGRAATYCWILLILAGLGMAFMRRRRNG